MRGGGGRVRGGGQVGVGCQGGWERRIKAFVKIQKNFFFGGGGSGWGVGKGGGNRVDVNEEVKLL